MTFSKEQFVNIINRLKAANDLQNDVQNLMYEAQENIDNDFMNAASLMINHEDVVVNLLQVIMNDEYDDIPYFIYELDYGRDYYPGCISEFGGKNIDFSTPEALYDYLIRKHKENKNESK